MENKRLSNKLNSWFWFILTALPLIIFFIYYIFGMPQYAKNYDWTNNNFGNFMTSSYSTSIIQNIFSNFNNYTIPSITTTFYRLFGALGVNNVSIFSYIFAWALSVQVYHLIYDVLKFIIEWCHNLIEKAY